jgi:hypothetical protein
MHGLLSSNLLNQMIIRNSASNSFLRALKTIYQEKLVTTMGLPTKKQINKLIKT